MPVAWAIEGDGCVAMFMAVSAVAAAWGAACTSVGGRSMRNYLKFSLYILIEIAPEHNKIYILYNKKLGSHYSVCF
jgi:hypothetical protein